MYLYTLYIHSYTLTHNNNTIKKLNDDDDIKIKGFSNVWQKKTRKKEKRI